MLVGYRDSRSAGGSLRVLETLAKSLPEEGFDVEILFAYGNGEGVVNYCSCPVHLIRARGPYDFSAWLRVRSLIRKRGPSIIQFVDNINWMILALYGSSIVKLLYAHGRISLGKAILKKWFIAQLQFRLTHGVVAISFGAKRSLISLGFVLSTKVWVVQNGVDCRFEATASSLQTSKAIRKLNTVVLGMACRLVKFKGIWEAIEIIRLLPDHWRLKIAGEGPARQALEQCIVDYGLESRVILLGNVEEMEDFYNSIDYYLFLSWYEPFGLVLAEAMFTGTPIVGLRAEGEYAESEFPLVDESVAFLLMRKDPFDCENGTTIEDLSAFAEELQVLHEDSQRRRIMTYKARERVCTGFLASHQASKLANVYRSIIKS